MAARGAGGGGLIRGGRGIRGGRATQQSFNRAASRIAAAARQLHKDVGIGLRLIGEEVMTDVKASTPGHGVPRKTGNLASTGRVDGPRASAATGRASVELSFGGAAAPYALVQHERTDFHHELGESRYLVRGLERWRPGGSAAMAAVRANAQAGLDAVARRGA